MKANSQARTDTVEVNYSRSQLPSSRAKLTPIAELLWALSQSPGALGGAIHKLFETQFD